MGEIFSRSTSTSLQRPTCRADEHLDSTSLWVVTHITRMSLAQVAGSMVSRALRKAQIRSAQCLESVNGLGQGHGIAVGPVSRLVQIR